ncbi:MAG: type II secretion system F family protein [bacterium]
MPTAIQLQKIAKKRNNQYKDKSIQDKKIDFNFSLRNRVKYKELSDFTRQLATMNNAGIPLVKGLGMLARQQKNHFFKKILQDIVNKVKSGDTLAHSLGDYPRQFSNLYVHMVRVGEVTGNMPEVLEQIATYLEKINGLKRKLLTALTYPAVVVGVAAGTIGFLLFGVIPSFIDMFEQAGQEIPAATRILIDSGNFVRGNWIWILGAFFCLYIGMRMYFRTDKGSLRWDTIKIKIPLLGKVIRKVLMARFATTLGNLLESGISLLEALEVTAQSSGNRVVSREINHMKEMAKKGEAMEHSLSGSKIFPDLVVQMVAVGEETAELPGMLLKTAEYYEKDVDAAIEALTSIVEPLIIVILGAILGGAIVTIYLQIFDMMNVIQ